MAEIPEGKLEEVAHLLIDLDIPKNSAKILAFVILAEQEAKATDIEGKTGLRQPEVSIAVKHLRSIGWLNKKDIKKEVKGRPVHIYSLAMPIESFFIELEKIQKKKIEQMQNSLKKLKEEINF